MIAADGGDVHGTFGYLAHALEILHGALNSPFMPNQYWLHLEAAKRASAVVAEALSATLTP